MLLPVSTVRTIAAAELAGYDVEPAFGAFAGPISVARSGTPSRCDRKPTGSPSPSRSTWQPPAPT